MALAQPVELDGNYDRGQPVFPASFSSSWLDAILTGGMAILDNATLVNPATQITASTRRIVNRAGWKGTNLIVSLAYDAAATVTTPGSIRCFGRNHSSDRWAALRTRSGALSLVLAVDALDTSDGTLKYTTPNLATDPFDCCGCNEFLLGVSVIHAVSAGNAALAKLQAKII